MVVTEEGEGRARGQEGEGGSIYANERDNHKQLLIFVCVTRGVGLPAGPCAKGDMRDKMAAAAAAACAELW